MIQEFEVLVLDGNGRWRRDGLKYLGRSAEREVKRLVRHGIQARHLPYRDIQERQVVA